MRNVLRAKGFHFIIAAMAGVASAASVAHAADNVAGNLMLVNDNGAWSWFEDERAIVDGGTGNVLVGSIADISGMGGSTRNGKVEVASFNLTTRRVSRSNIGTLTADDHNTPALLTRPDGRYLAAYAGHNSDALTRYRVSTSPGDPTSWGPEQTFNNGVGTTYNNVYRLANEGKTYNFTRTVGFDPNYLVSTNDGSSWAYGGKLLKDPANSDGGRPYLKYASNNTDKIHFITTEGHPRNYNNGVYHGYVQGGMLYKSDGTAVGALGSAPAANAFTPVMPQNTSVDGTTRTHGWTTDLTLDAAGTPHAIFTSRVNSSSGDHRMYYGKLTASGWDVSELSRVGAGLYGAEGDYTGLGAINPRNPNEVFISTNFIPGTNTPLPKREIYKGVTNNNGGAWTWTAITEDSSVDNLRPVIPQWDNGTAVMWMRGKYTSYTDYNMGIVGLVEQDGDRVDPIRYADATLANTTLASGAPFTPTGPSDDNGQSDGNWHRYTQFGNGGESLLAYESEPFDAPRLKTTMTDVAPGTYDVFAFFWGGVNSDFQITAGLSDDEMRVFRQLQVEQAVAGDFDGPVELISLTTGASLYKAYLGRTTLAAPGELSVLIDDVPFLSDGGGGVTFYDGIGLAQVVPEPGTALGAAALGGLALLRRRRATIAACPR